MMAVEVKSGAAFAYGTATELFDSQFVTLSHPGGDYIGYAVSRDGRRFLISRPASPSSDTSANFVTVVLNWPLLLKK